MLKNRFKGIKGSSYLTHGSDDYDHQGLKKALRAASRDLIQEAIEEADTTTDTTHSTGYRLVIQTQCYENYGAHDWNGEGECPQYWKAKGGSEYHLPIDDITTTCHTKLQQMVQEHRHLIESCTDSWHEYIIDWSIYGNNELTPEEEMDADACPWMLESIKHQKHQREIGWRS